MRGGGKDWVYSPLLIGICLFCFLISLWFEYQRRQREKRVLLFVAEAARRFCVDPYLVLSIISVESNFRPDCLGSKGEVGLMQLMPYNVKRAGKTLRIFLGRDLKKAFSPRVNILLGSWYISQLKKYPHLPLYERIARQAAEYNSGLKNVIRWEKRAKKKGISFWEAITYPTTKLYVQKVLSEYRRYRRQRVFEKIKKREGKGKGKPS